MSSSICARREAITSAWGLDAARAAVLSISWFNRLVLLDECGCAADMSSGLGMT